MKNRKEAGQGGRPRGDSLAELTICRQRLLASERRLFEALVACPDSILLIDREGRITHLNAAAQRLLGASGRSLEGSNYTDAFWRITTVNGIASPEQGPALLVRIQNAEVLAGEQFTLERPDGTRIALEIETSPIFDEGDGLAGTIMRLTEVVGDRPSADHEGDRGIYVMRDQVGVIANDFNNILTAIIGNISLARTEVSREDEVYKTLTYVEKASMRALDLAQRLLSLAGEGIIGSAAGAPPARFPEGEAIRGAGRILVMDDEEMVRHVVSRMLTHLGYEVAVARDGAETLAMYAEARAEGRPYCAVIMDLTVPDGMGGRETLDELVRIDPDVRAIISTGFSTDPIITKFRQHGFRSAVKKPYEITQLSSAVHQALEEQS